MEKGKKKRERQGILKKDRESRKMRDEKIWIKDKKEEKN